MSLLVRIGRHPECQVHFLALFQVSIEPAWNTHLCNEKLIFVDRSPFARHNCRLSNQCLLRMRSSIRQQQQHLMSTEIITASSTYHS